MLTRIITPFSREMSLWENGVNLTALSALTAVRQATGRRQAGTMNERWIVRLDAGNPVPIIISDFAGDIHISIYTPEEL